MSALRRLFLAVQAAIAPTSITLANYFVNWPEKTSRIAICLHQDACAGQEFGVQPSLRLCAQSAKLSIELRRPAAAIGGLGVSALGEKGGIGAPAATGLKFPTMQGRIALPAPSAAAAQPRAAAPIKGGACETAPVEGGFAAERRIERDGRERLVSGVCDDACLIDFPQRRDTAANRRQATLGERTGAPQSAAPDDPSGRSAHGMARAPRQAKAVGVRLRRP